MANLIEEGVLLLHEWDFFTIFLPFIIFYVIIYAILNKVNLLGKDKKNYNAIFAFSLSFLTVYKLDLQENFSFLLSRFSILIIMLALIIMISSFLGSEKYYSKSITIILVLIYILYAVIDAFFDISILYDYISLKIPLNSIIPILVAFVVFFSIVWFILKPEKSNISSENNFQEEEKTNLKGNKNNENQTSQKKDYSDAKDTRDFLEKGSTEAFK